MTPRRILALAVLLAAWVPAIASIVIEWAFALPDEPLPGVFLSMSPPNVQSRFDDIGVVVALIYGALCAVLIDRRPHPVVPLLAVHAIGSGIAALGVQWGLLGAQVPDLPLWGILSHAAGFGYILGTTSTCIVPVLLLRRPLGRAGAAVVGTGLVLAVATFLPALVHQAAVDPALGGPLNPLAFGDAAFQAALPMVYEVSAVLAVTLSAGVAAWVVREWKGSSDHRRPRLAWLAIGHAFLTASYAALVIPSSEAVPDAVWDFGMIAPVVGQMFYPSAVLVIVLGARLRGIDVAVSRVLVWTILTVAAATAYLVVGELLAGALALEPVQIGIIAAAVVALALQPARQGIVRAVDRLLYGADGDPARLLERLGERVGEFDSGAEGLAGLAEALRGALRVASVEIVPDDPDAPAAEAGVVAGEPHRIPLRAGGERIGEIRVRPRPGERLPRRAVRDLEDLAVVVATALRLAVASAKLSAARDALVAARQAERRSLRRDLHDGIGPALAGVGFGLAAVDNLRATDPAAAGEFAGRLARDLREQLAEVRRLARSVRPPDIVLELGVELAELAADFAGAGIEVRVDAPAAWRVPQEHVRAVYLIAAEAVHNAIRHAGADRIDITLRETGGGVSLVVADDGHGFDLDLTAEGVGLTTMRERAVEAGAVFDIQSGPTGTALSLTLTDPTIRAVEHIA